MSRWVRCAACGPPSLRGGGRIKSLECVSVTKDGYLDKDKINDLVYCTKCKTYVSVACWDRMRQGAVSLLGEIAGRQEVGGLLQRGRVLVRGLVPLPLALQLCRLREHRRQLRAEQHAEEGITERGEYNGATDRT